MADLHYEDGHFFREDLEGNKILLSEEEMREMFRANMGRIIEIPDPQQEMIELLKEISEKLDKPMIQVVNNGAGEPVSKINPEEKTEAERLMSLDFQARESSMLLGTVHGLKISLEEVLDNPALDTFKKAQALRGLVARMIGMMDEYQKNLDRIKKERQ